jgi:hypothetical protein
MGENIIDLDRRKYRRVPIECPVDYRIGAINLKGVTVNAGSEGIIVKSSVSLETAFEIFKTLDNEPNYHTDLEIDSEGRTYLIDAETKHFHLDSSDDKGYVLRVGFGFLYHRMRFREKD